MHRLMWLVLVLIGFALTGQLFAQEESLEFSNPCYAGNQMPVKAGIMILEEPYFLEITILSNTSALFRIYNQETTQTMGSPVILDGINIEQVGTTNVVCLTLFQWVEVIEGLDINSYRTSLDVEVTQLNNLEEGALVTARQYFNENCPSTATNYLLWVQLAQSELAELPTNSVLRFEVSLFYGNDAPITPTLTGTVTLQDLRDGDLPELQICTSETLTSANLELTTLEGESVWFSEAELEIIYND